MTGHTFLTEWRFRNKTGKILNSGEEPPHGSAPRCRAAGGRRQRRAAFRASDGVRERAVLGLTGRDPRLAGEAARLRSGGSGHPAGGGRHIPGLPRPAGGGPAAAGWRRPRLRLGDPAPPPAGAAVTAEPPGRPGARGAEAPAEPGGRLSEGGASEAAALERRAAAAASRKTFQEGAQAAPPPSPPPARPSPSLLLPLPPPPPSRICAPVQRKKKILSLARGGRALSSRSAPQQSGAGVGVWRRRRSARRPGGRAGEPGLRASRAVGAGGAGGAREPCQAAARSRRARRGEPSATACCGDAPVDITLAAGRTA